MKNVLGLIPARGGSKRIPRKNIADLGGKPLIQWTIDAAKQSGIFDDIVVSSDDETVRGIAMQNNIQVLWRPAHLSSDNMDMLPVVRHAMEAYPSARTIVLLQPTSPFRSAGHIKDAYRIWQDDGRDSLVSVDDCGIENGAIYIQKADAIRRGDLIYDDKSIQYPMGGGAASLDIDFPEQLEHARSILVDINR